MENNIIKADVLGCRVDIRREEDIFSLAEKTINEGRSFQIITINPEMIMNASKDANFKEIVNKADLNIADGIGVKIALKLKKISNNHIRGVDLARKLVELANNKNYKIAFFGAKQEVIEKTIENFKTKYNNLNIVYYRNGYFDEIEPILDEIAIAKPNILLVGLGSPAQEKVIEKLKEKLNSCVMIGVGGSFDVFSGLTKEAPEIYQKLGLEWLYRTLKEPKRFKRIFPTLPLFLIKCIMDKNNV